MILGAGIGVIYGASLGADATHQLGLAIVAGLLLLLLAIGFWLAWVRPFERFRRYQHPGGTRAPLSPDG